jgi:hypothetical protein
MQMDRRSFLTSFAAALGGVAALALAAPRAEAMVPMAPLPEPDSPANELQPAVLHDADMGDAKLEEARWVWVRRRRRIRWWRVRRRRFFFRVRRRRFFFRARRRRWWFRRRRWR